MNDNIPALIAEARAESAWRAAALANESEEAMADERDRYRSEAESARKAGERILADALRYRAAIEEALELIQPGHFMRPDEPGYAGTTRDVVSARTVLTRALNENGEDR